MPTDALVVGGISSEPALDWPGLDVRVSSVAAGDWLRLAERNDIGSEVVPGWVGSEVIPGWVSSEVLPGWVGSEEVPIWVGIEVVLSGVSSEVISGWLGTEVEAR